MLENSKGEIFYGMHFYPGVAQYDDPEQSYRVFVNEDTIRKMNPTFAGRPVFVEHVDEVDNDVDTLRNDADGWVIESFYNAADGKTWAKFIIVSDRGLAAVKQGYRLSNAYIPTLAETKATWNGVDYQRVVTGGEFEHLAIVTNPRYDESVIMTPDEFKAYNENLKSELVRLANSKGKKEKTPMKLNIFRRLKVENSKEVNFDGLVVRLPKSKKDMSLTAIVEEYDKILNARLVNLKRSNADAGGYKKSGSGGSDSEPGTKKDKINPGDVKENDDLDNDDLDNDDMDNDGGADFDSIPASADAGKVNDDDVDNDDLDNDDLDNDDSGSGYDPGQDVASDSEFEIGGDRPRGEEHDPSVGGQFEKKADRKIAKGGSPPNKSLANRKRMANRQAARRLRNANINNQRDNTEYAKLDLAEDQLARGRARYGSN